MSRTIPTHRLIVWRARLLAARKQGSFSEDAQRDAYDWKSCAIAEAHQSEPQAVKVVSWGPPSDKGLRHAGVAFGHAVYGNNFRAAAFCLTRIERRLDALAAAEKGRKE